MLTVSRRRPSWSLAWATWTSPWVSTPTVTRVGWACAMVVMAISLRAWGWMARAGRVGGQHCDGSVGTGFYQVTLARLAVRGGGRGVEPTDQVKGTKPVDRWGQALTAATGDIIAVDPAAGRRGDLADVRGQLPPRARVVAAAPPPLEPPAPRPARGRARRGRHRAVASRGLAEDQGGALRR